MPNLTAEQQKALDEFKAIRNVLRVPFPQDLKDLQPAEFPEDRRWKGPCLGYQMPRPIFTIASPTQAEKPKTEKKT